MEGYGTLTVCLSVIENQLNTVTNYKTQFDNNKSIKIS